MAAATGVGIGSLANGVTSGMGMGLQYQNYQDMRAREEEIQRQQDELRDRLAQQQQKQGQGGGIDPSMVSQFMPQAGGGAAGGAAAGGESAGVGAMGMPTAFGSYAGGAGAAGGASSSGVGAMGLPTAFGSYAGGGAASTGGAAAGGASGGSAIAGAGPWAGLAAIIAVNEKSARNGGHRRDGWQYGKDVLGGKVVEQDMNERWAPRAFGNNDKTHLGHDAKAVGEFSSLDFSNGFKQMGQGAVPTLIKKIF